MIVYRVDRSSKLVPNQTINLTENVKLQNVFNIYNNSFSKHGIRYLNNYSDDSVWKLCLEFIRLNYFPQFPSRLQSTFGVKTSDEAISWKNYFSTESNSKINICKLECEKAYEFDANWITNPPNIPNIDYSFNQPSIAKMLELSYKYWNQEKTNNPFLELVIPLPAKVIEIL